MGDCAQVICNYAILYEGVEFPRSLVSVGGSETNLCCPFLFIYIFYAGYQSNTQKEARIWCINVTLRTWKQKSVTQKHSSMIPSKCIELEACRQHFPGCTSCCFFLLAILEYYGKKQDVNHSVVAFWDTMSLEALLYFLASISKVAIFLMKVAIFSGGFWVNYQEKNNY